MDRVDLKKHSHLPSKHRSSKVDCGWIIPTDKQIDFHKVEKKNGMLRKDDPLFRLDDYKAYVHPDFCLSTSHDYL